MKTSPVVRAALAAILAAGLECGAVSLGADGTGQALIFPYYTAQSSDGNPFNTYISLVNHSSQAKALRVRLRESRLAKETLSMNLFLGPNDAWAGALVPVGVGVILLTLDSSCTDPGFAVDFSVPPSPPYLGLRSDAYSGANDDGAGTEPARLREGFIEVVEMATLTGASATAATHNQTGQVNCDALRGNAAPSVAAPTGGISGTLTLINVASGRDFTVNAEALAGLATRPYFRLPADPYPGLAVEEIDPVSIVVANGNIYRSAWTVPVDAVSAVLMRSHVMGEYVLDAGTRSRTDMVITFPTRQHYVTRTTGHPPFTTPAIWANNCATAANQFTGELMEVRAATREESGEQFGNTGFPDPVPPRACGAASVISFASGESYQAAGALGSLSRGFVATSSALPGVVALLPTFANGWARIRPYMGANLTSLATSTRTNVATGAVTGGSHVFTGLPMLGFTARTFENGTLHCGTSSCQGNYGGAYPLKSQRTISPAN